MPDHRARRISGSASLLVLVCQDVLGISHVSHVLGDRVWKVCNDRIILAYTLMRKSGIQSVEHICGVAFKSDDVQWSCFRLLDPQQWPDVKGITLLES